ncbi:MAG: PAS domain S-box protein [Actinobacteria bacterium]|nr:MAG: PAS domain S-box protein [Actinomycetota bacterium]
MTEQRRFRRLGRRDTSPHGSAPTQAFPRESEERYRTIVETAREGIWMVDADGATTFVNGRVAEMLGREPSEIVGRPLSDFMDSRQAAESSARLAAVRRGESVQGEARLVRKDGSELVAAVSCSPLHDEDGDYAGAVGMLTDITERQKLEAQVHQAQRLEGLGRLAGGVAHDFNNLLAVILNYASFVEHAVEDRPDVRADVAEIRRAAEVAASVTQRLLVFSRRDLPHTRILRLDHALADTARVLDRTIGEDIRLETEVDRDLASIIADPGQIEQLLLNLVVNARDAMPGGGTLTIRVRNRRIGGDAPDLRAGDYVALEVADTGCGMAPEVQARAFEPFFTTKAKEQGTGLGLATVYGIVKQAGGAVRLASEVGRGTTVTALFPASELQMAEAGLPETAAAEPSRGHGETVLVVEDDSAVRRVASRILSETGYTVLEADGPLSALELPAVQHGKVDLLVTDAVMPAMSGKELADRLRQERPGIAVLFMSGYTDEVVTRQGISDDQLNFIQKPFGADELLARVELALGGRSKPVSGSA